MKEFKCFYKEVKGNEGDVVIDPCCGSASTLRAARDIGRNAYGFEIDKNFYARAKAEMLAPSAQIEMEDILNESSDSL